jgi:two-component system cell cycle response regulator
VLEAFGMSTVAFMRIPTGEVSLLRNMFDVIAARGLLYQVAETPDEIATAEIVIVDGDNSTAMTLWNALKQERSDVIGILVAKRPIEGDGQLWIQRPLNSMKVLAALGKAEVKRNPARPIKRNAAQTDVPRTLKGMRVLIIDDSATVRKQLELALAEQEMYVLTADTGELGLHLLSLHNFDLIFLDVVLPGADGYQICRTIKRNKLKQNVPVVMLTSRSSPFDRVKGSLAGCDTYLTKPVELKKLVAVLEKHLARRALLGERPTDMALAPSGARAAEV